MKKFMLLHFGFEKPTPEIMAAWGEWFESVADKSVENGGFPRRCARNLALRNEGPADGNGIHHGLLDHQRREP